MTSRIQQFIRVWAFGGGLLLCAVVLLNALSVISSALFNKPFAGDFELTEMGIGIAVFCFLPYCQLVGANVSADIFTSGISQKAQYRLELIGHFVVLLFAILLLWRMSAGLLDYIEYEEFTGVLNIPIWWAFVPALASLFLLTLAACLSLGETWTKI